MATTAQTEQAAPVLDPTDASGADGANGATDRKPRTRRTTRKPTEPKRGVTVKHVRPEEPDYSKMPARSCAKAKREYEKALAEWKAAEERAAEAKIDSETNLIGSKVTGRKPASPKAQTRKTAQGSSVAASDDGFDWKAADLPARILELKQTGLTIKQVTEKLGFPADAGERIWHRVSLIYRAAADAKGIERPHRQTTKK